MTLRATVILSSLFLVLLLTNCKSQIKLFKTSVDSLAVKQLGVVATKEFNPAKTYVLFQDAEDSVSFQHSVHYAIYRVKDHHLELEGHFSRGHARWLNDQKVEIKNVPEKAKDDIDMTPYIREVLIY
jgi:hypothetical protein